MRERLTYIFTTASSFRLFLLAGFCLGVGFLLPILWWLVLPGIALFFLAVLRGLVWWQVFLGGILAFTAKMLFSIGWFWTTYPIEWIDLSLGAAELPVIGFYWFTVALAIGLSGGCLALAIFALLRVHPLSSTHKLWFFPPLFVLSELLGALFFSIFTYGAGGTVNLVFSFGSAGYLLAEYTPALLLARWGGVYLLSFLAVALGIILFSLIGRYFDHPRFFKVVGGLILLVIVTNYGGEALISKVVPKRDITVAVVDTRFGGTEYFSLEDRETVRLPALSEAMSAALATGADYVIFPEDSRTVNSTLGTALAYETFAQQNNLEGTTVVVAGQVPIGLHETTLRASVYDGQSETGYVADKQYLVPQGEFMPYFYLAILDLVGLQETAESIRAKLAYRPGPYESQATLPDHVPGVLFCFADADPLAVWRLQNERKMPFIAHPISHAWFHSPESLWYQFDTMLKVQAVFNQIPIVSAGNMVEGALYTENGKKIIPESVVVGDYYAVKLLKL